MADLSHQPASRSVPLQRGHGPSHPSVGDSSIARPSGMDGPHRKVQVCSSIKNIQSRDHSETARAAATSPREQPQELRGGRTREGPVPSGVGTFVSIRHGRIGHRRLARPRSASPPMCQCKQAPLGPSHARNRETHSSQNPCMSGDAAERRSARGGQVCTIGLVNHARGPTAHKRTAGQPCRATKVLVPGSSSCVTTSREKRPHLAGYLRGPRPRSREPSAIGGCSGGLTRRRGPRHQARTDPSPEFSVDRSIRTHHGSPANTLPGARASRGQPSDPPLPDSADAGNLHGKLTAAEAHNVPTKCFLQSPDSLEKNLKLQTPSFMWAETNRGTLRGSSRLSRGFHLITH